MEKWKYDLDRWITREQPVELDEEPTGLICGILENKRLGNCSNNGISSRCSQVTVILKRARIAMYPDTSEAPAVKIVKRHLFGRDYYHVEPIDGEGYMMGGTFIDLHLQEVVLEDGTKILFDYPLPFHDRQETTEEAKLYGGD